MDSAPTAVILRRNPLRAWYDGCIHRRNLVLRWILMHTFGGRDVLFAEYERGFQDCLRRNVFGRVVMEDGEAKEIELVIDTLIDGNPVGVRLLSEARELLGRRV